MKWSLLVSVNAVFLVWLWLQISIILYWICGNHAYTLSFRRDDSFYHNLNVSDYAEHRKATNWVHAEIANLSKQARRAKLKVKAPICLAIPTVPRMGHTYITRTVQSILAHIDPVEQEQLHKILAISHLQNQVHTDALQLAPLFDVVVEQTVPAADKFTKDDWLTNENKDYIRVLSLCSEYGSNYTLILQDDVRASKHVVSKISRMLTQIPSADWCAVKLFFSEYYTGWGVEELPALIGVSAALGLTLALPPWLACSRTLRARLGRPKALATGAAWSAGLSLLSAWALLFVGRQNLVTLGHIPPLRAVGFARYRRGFNPWTPSANLAIVFSNRCTPGVARALREERRGLPVDLALDAHLAALAAPSFTFLPSLFQHAGHFSSLRYKNQPTYKQQLYDFKTALTWTWD